MEAAQVRYQPLWKARLGLMRKSWASNWELFRDSKIGPIGLAIIIFFGIFGAMHPLLMATVWDPAIYDPVTGYDPLTDAQLMRGLTHPLPPSTKHLLGTDPWGRDILSQLMYSTRAEFFLGVFAAFVTVFIGTLIGCISAYYGGFTDTFFMRLADVVMLFPLLAFLIVLSAMINLNLYTLAIVIGVIGGFGGITVILKSQALAVKVKPYIEAAKVAGGSHIHIIATHIIPNVLPLSFLYMMFSVTGAIFTEAVLSFFGLMNIQMSWGLMVEMANISGYLVGGAVTQYWWVFWPASLSISLLCTAFYLVGRGIDEIVNPKLRKR
jgi:peptide/nickel transport system permease protein